MAHTIRFLTPRNLLLLGVGSSFAVAAWGLRAPAASSAIFATLSAEESGTSESTDSASVDNPAARAAHGARSAANARTQQNSGSDGTRSDTRRARPGTSGDDDSHDGSESSEEAPLAQTEGSESAANAEGSFWSRVKRSVFGSEASANISHGNVALLAPGAVAPPASNSKPAEVPWNPAATNNNGAPTGTNGIATTFAGALETACDKCRETNCRHYLDTDLVEACFEQINAEHGADVSDKLFLRSCQDVMACAHSTGCAYGPFGPAPCYCGSASVDDCTKGAPAPDAPCRSRWQIAARTDDHSLVLNRMSDAAFPSGWAYALLECEREYCRDACSPH